MELEIEEMPGFEDIDFTEISIPQKKKLNKYDLSLLLDNLYEIYDRTEDIEDQEDINDIEEVEEDLINPLDVIRKYRKLLDKNIEIKKPVEEWRVNIPKYIKANVKNWRTESIHSVYEQSKALMRIFTGKNKEKIMDFVCDLSEIIFEEPKEEKISLDDKGLVEDWVLSHVEMIILPQLEVLERLENNHGILIFDDSWASALTQALIKEVYEREGRHCFICKNKKNKLHLHQLISIKLEKRYHKENLVPLCNSCDNAVNTTNVNIAFPHCLRNFTENY